MQKKLVNVKYLPNILDKEGTLPRKSKDLFYVRGKTIPEYVKEAGFDIEDKRIIVSGKRIEKEFIDTHWIEGGDEILVIPIIEAPVAGIISVIGTLLAMGGGAWGATATATFLGVSWSTWGVIGTVMMIGGAIVSSLMQPRTPSLAGGGDEDSPTYGWDGVATTQNVGVPVAIVYGEHKVGGNIINQYIRNDGDKSYLNILLALCEGEIESISDVKINDNPIANYDEVTTYERYGTNDQEVISNFEDAHNVYMVSTNLTYNNAHTYTTIDSDVEAFEVFLKLGSGLYQQDSGGAITEWSVTVKIEYKLHTDPTYTELGTYTITAKSRSVIRRSYKKTGLTAGQYDIRITRTSEDSSLDPIKQGDLAWDKVDELKTDDFAYPNTALLGIEALATEQLSGSMPNFTCVVKGKKVSIPKVTMDYLNIALVIGNTGSPNGNDTTMKSILEGLGHTVTYKDDNDSAWTPTDYDCIVIMESTQSSYVEWLKSTEVGVLYLEPACNDEFDMSSGYSNPPTDKDVKIKDNTHYITSDYDDEEEIEVSSTDNDIATIDTVTGDVINLVASVATPTKSFMAIAEVGTLLGDGTYATGRRVFCGFYSATGITADGTNLLTKALNWVGYKTSSEYTYEDEIDWEDYYYDSEEECYRLFEDGTKLNWDGSTFVDRYCANPVWCLKDLILGSRYGIGEFIGSSEVDDTLFLEMSQYCEEQIPNGAGSYEKRFRLDMVLDSSSSALDLLMQICVTFRGLPFYSNGIIKLRIDKPETPVQLFTMGNIILDSFSQNWKSKKDVPNVIEVQFLDKDKDYEQDTIAYIDETALADGDPMRKKQIRMYTTRLSQAIREGRYALKCAKYLNRSVAFKAGIESIACQAGDVISLSHDVPQWGFSGRVVSATSSSVTLDQEVTIEDGVNYKIQVQLNNDTIVEKTVTNSPGTTNVISISGTFTSTPNEFDLYVFGESSSLKKDFRILSMKRSSIDEVDILAIEYNENCYDDSSIDLPNNNYSALTLEIPNVESLVLSEQIVKLPDGTIADAIDVWWDIPDRSNYVRRYAKAKIYISETGGDTKSDYRYVGESAGRHYQINRDIVDGGTYYIKVVTITDDGREGVFADAPGSSISVVGKSAPPSDVSSFIVNQNRDRLIFGWSEVSDVDVWGYEIRWGSSWSSGQQIAFVQGDKHITTNFRTGSGQSYWIKAIDTSGNYSENATEAVVTVDQIPFRNIILETSEESSWSGDMDDTEVDGSNLQIVDGELTGTYTTPVVDVGYVATFLLGIEAITTISSGARFNDDGTTRFNSSETLRFTGEESPGSATFEVKISEDNITWSDWATWQFGDYKCRYYQLRMTLTRENVADDLECSQLKHYADLPDVDEYGSDSVSVAGDGATIVFDKEFHEAPNVHIEITSGTGVYIRFTAKDEDGFTVKLYDASGTAVTGDFEWHAHGV